MKEQLLREYRELSERLGKRVDAVYEFLENECMGHSDELDAKILMLLNEYKETKR